MILGNHCTRDCRFCAVSHGKPDEVDVEEPQRVAAAVKTLGLKYAVITSVTRDDLDDGGASMFVETIRRIRQEVPACIVEVLIPDFQGDQHALNIVLDALPDVLNHNVETVPRLYPEARPQAAYARSIQLLDRVKEAGITTKSGVMLGLGEEDEEVIQVMADLRAIGCDFFTMGQYLQPTSRHLPIARYLSPAEFEELKQCGVAMGFVHIEAGPLVRSSYHAAAQPVHFLKR